MEDGMRPGDHGALIGDRGLTGANNAQELEIRKWHQSINIKSLFNASKRDKVGTLSTLQYYLVCEKEMTFSSTAE